MVASMGLTAMSLLTTIYIVSVFYHNPRKEVPNWLKKYILNGVAKTTCYTANENQEQNTPGHEAMQTRKGRQDHWVAEERIRNPKMLSVLTEFHVPQCLFRITTRLGIQLMQELI